VGMLSVYVHTTFHGALYAAHGKHMQFGRV
jgi:hypothetical protein